MEYEHKTNRTKNNIDRYRMPISNSMDDTVREKNTPLNALYERMGTDTVHVTPLSLPFKPYNRE